MFTLPRSEDTRAGCAVATSNLVSIPHAVVGGAACSLLGCPQRTEDIDIVVPRGSVAAARQLLSQSGPGITVDPRTKHTFYHPDVDGTEETPDVKDAPAPGVEDAEDKAKSKAPEKVNIPIELLSPPTMFRRPFDATTPTVTKWINGHAVKVLHPLILLDGKLDSVNQRPTTALRAKDYNHIVFLVDLLVSDWGQQVTPETVPLATQEYVRYLVQGHGSPEVWRRAGYDV